MLDLRSGLNNYTSDLALSQRRAADPTAVFQPDDLI